MMPGEVVKWWSCFAPIIWVSTKAGKSMPINAGTWTEGATEFDASKGHISHFATCPQANRHRRRK